MAANYVIIAAKIVALKTLIIKNPGWPEARRG
jgi:hypothetical protein